jgi:hypothetical protein
VVAVIIIRRLVPSFTYCHVLKPLTPIGVVTPSNSVQILALLAPGHVNSEILTAVVAAGYCGLNPVPLFPVGYSIEQDNILALITPA